MRFGFAFILIFGATVVSSPIANARSPEDFLALRARVKTAIVATEAESAREPFRSFFTQAFPGFSEAIHFALSAIDSIPISEASGDLACGANRVSRPLAFFDSKKPESGIHLCSLPDSRPDIAIEPVIIHELVHAAGDFSEEHAAIAELFVSLVEHLPLTPGYLLDPKYPALRNEFSELYGLVTGKKPIPREGVVAFDFNDRHGTAFPNSDAPIGLKINPAISSILPSLAEKTNIFEQTRLLPINPRNTPSNLLTSCSVSYLSDFTSGVTGLGEIRDGHLRIWGWKIYEYAPHTFVNSGEIPYREFDTRILYVDRYYRLVCTQIFPGPLSLDDVEEALGDRNATND